jgi:hypothetical protein
VNRFVAALLALGLLVLLPLAPARAADDLSGAHDFDFEFGDWTVHHKIKRPSGEWIEFDGWSKTWPVLDGRGNVEDNLFHRPGGDTRGLATRAYDPATGTWAIWWIDSRAPHSAMDPPVKGRFVNGVGSFYADGLLNGKQTRTRYMWSKITPTSAQWEQSFSTDDGKTWDTNWIMSFTRVPPKK